MIYLSTLLMAVLITIGMMPALRALAIRYNAVDIPNERKIHTQAVPRVGGIAMALGAFLPLLYWNTMDRFIGSFLAGGAVLVLFGLLDDFYDLSPKFKFLGQITAALIIVVGGEVRIQSLGALLPDSCQLPLALALPLTVVAIVGVTNAINLADGLDGLAGGISLLIFCCIGYLAYLEGCMEIGLISLALAGAIFGFLRFNTYPASVFMGDAGSQLLGFSAVTLSLAMTQGQIALSPLLPLILVGFPVLDTLTVMFCRIAQGRSPFAADKNHFHHNLMEIGLNHSESVLVIYIIQTMLIVAALLLRFHSDWLILSGYIVFSVVVIVSFSTARRTGWRIKRFDLLDVLIIGQLRNLKDKGRFSRVIFTISYNGLPLLLLVTCILSSRVPPSVSYAGLGLAALLAAAWATGKEKRGNALRMTLYLLIPFAVYFSDKNLATTMSVVSIKLYNGVFWIFAVAIVFLSKFSRRKGGFKSTPLDFLILFIVLIGLNLPEPRIQELSVGLVGVKIIIFYFCFEVLLAELQGKFGRITASTIVSLLVLAAR